MTIVQQPRKLKDDAAFVRLKTAHHVHAITLHVNASRLNRPGSPVFDPWENIVPLLAMILLSLTFMFAANEIAGVALLVLSVVAYLVIIRPWILQRVQNRTREVAMISLRNWTILWKTGAISFSLNHKNASCRSPSDDWQSFVTEHLAIETPDAALFKKTTHVEKDSASGTATQSIEF